MKFTCFALKVMTYPGLSGGTDFSWVRGIHSSLQWIDSYTYVYVIHTVEVKKIHQRWMLILENPKRKGTREAESETNESEHLIYSSCMLKEKEGVRLPD